ncbi:MAG: adenosylcobinamide-GDP ribazoletransferase [Chlorobi bacterium]|nr:adenosylcobinamide-GDP ribazoletransferase [Chlorobiota bacterium]
MLLQTARGLVTALRTLTILPVPGRDAERFSMSLYWFPVVGLFLGGVQATVMYALRLAGWVEFAGFAAVLCGVLLTRGMHVDGLADLADGFWGGKNREAALRIMKDPAVGSFGVLALVFVMLLKWLAATRLAMFQDYSTFVAGIVLGRWVQVILAALMPYARSEGGTARSFVTGAGKSHLAVTTVCSVLFLILLPHAAAAPVVVAIVSAAMVAAVMAVVAARKIGGVTGDVLGASSELAECAVWVACMLLSPTSS